MTVTFENLPASVHQIYQKLENMERLLLEKSNNNQPLPDCWFDLNELVEYDPEKRSKATFYGYVHERAIPFHKRGKKITFLKSEIDFWLKSGRRKTFLETAVEADQFLENKKRR
ncbi:MAG TPA: DNA-binding protein [Prolixibacteraceae bacterium]|nr:DNA-binding protein [Prolixibacteraceae bacterium]